MRGIVTVVVSVFGLSGCSAGSDGGVGPAGPAGDVGPEGPTGPAGDVGPEGPEGTAGADGVDGADGIDGVDGVDGADGTFSGDFAGDATFSGTATFQDDATFEANATFAGDVTFNGNVAFTGGIDLSSRVRVAPGGGMLGTDFQADVLAGTNMCDAGFHPCQAWEAMVIDTLSTTQIVSDGWTVGSFPNIDFHMRSLVNGQDSVVCPPGSLLWKYPSVFVQGAISTPGGLHCVGNGTFGNVLCCMDDT